MSLVNMITFLLYIKTIKRFNNSAVLNKYTTNKLFYKKRKWIGQGGWIHPFIGHKHFFRKTAAAFAKE